MANASICPSWLDENPLRLFPDANLFFEEDMNTVTNTIIYAMLLIGLIEFLKSLGQWQLVNVGDDQDLRDDQDRERLNVRTSINFSIQFENLLSTLNLESSSATYQCRSKWRGRSGLRYSKLGCKFSILIYRYYEVLRFL